MAKKLNKADLEAIIKVLPAKERNKLKGENLTVQWLEENIERCKALMKRDALIGIPWFLAYSVSLWKAGMNNITIAIFVIGMAYFVYTTFTTGSYGLNQKKVKVYKDILTKLK